MSELPRQSAEYPIPEVEGNINNLRETERTIVAAYILSKDDRLLMGRQDPAKGGTYPTARRIPGGGVKVDKDGKPVETLVEAMIREAGEEVIGLQLTPEALKQLPLTAALAAEKRLDSGEVVWQKMDLRHFEVQLDEVAAALPFLPGSDLIELGWLTRAERATVELIPGGRDLMLAGGYIDPRITT